jgi:hypothetical protein
MKHLKDRIQFLNESTSDDLRIDFFKYAYRWVGQWGLFVYFYGEDEDTDIDHREYLFPGEDITDLPPRKDVMEGSYEGSTIPMTVDPGYIGEPLNGETIIRMVFDLQKLLEDYGDSVENLLRNGEAEIRFTKPIKDWTKYLVKLDIDYDFYNNVAEDEFAEWRPLKEWIPNDIKTSKVETFKDDPYDRKEPKWGPRISKMLNTSRDVSFLDEFRKQGRI